MSAMHHAISLIVEGYTMVPDVFDPDELVAASEAFEEKAAVAGSRTMGWEEIQTAPAILNFLGHPKLMEIVDVYSNHFGERSMIAGASGMRDSFHQVPEPRDYTHLATAPIGWHDDVRGVTEPAGNAMQLALTALLYLDDTFENNGAYCAAIGSHHLSRVDAENRPVFCPPDVVLDNCRLVQVPVKAGSVIVHRAHNWHGVIPSRQQRRLVLQHFTVDSQYDLQAGHTQISEAVLSLLPPERRRYFRQYSVPI